MLSLGSLQIGNVYVEIVTALYANKFLCQDLIIILSTFSARMSWPPTHVFIKKIEKISKKSLDIVEDLGTNLKDIGDAVEYAT